MSNIVYIWWCNWSKKFFNKWLIAWRKLVLFFVLSEHGEPNDQQKRTDVCVCVCEWRVIENEGKKMWCPVGEERGLCRKIPVSSFRSQCATICANIQLTTRFWLRQHSLWFWWSRQGCKTDASSHNGEVVIGDVRACYWLTHRWTELARFGGCDTWARHVFECWICSDPAQSSKFSDRASLVHRRMNQCVFSKLYYCVGDSKHAVQSLCFIMLFLLRCGRASSTNYVTL